MTPYCMLSEEFELACANRGNDAAIDEQVGAGDELGVLTQQESGFICQC